MALYTVHNYRGTWKNVKHENYYRKLLVLVFFFAAGRRVTSFISLKHFYQSASSFLPDEPSTIITSASNIFTCKSIHKTVFMIITVSWKLKLFLLLDINSNNWRKITIHVLIKINKITNPRILNMQVGGIDAFIQIYALWLFIGNYTLIK